MKMLRMLVLALGLLAAAGCGGGGGGGDTGGGGSAVSGHVPYLLSAPTLTFAANGSEYDITVTVEADGPTGVQFADVWISDDTGANFDHIELFNIPGTKRWRGSTHPLLPLPAGNYRVDEVMLYDGDPLNDLPLRSGWYLIMDGISTSSYYVDEREETAADPFFFYNSGLTSIPVTRVTVTS